MIRRTGACLGLLAFCVTILCGLGAGNPPELILERALWAMAALFVLGLVLGYVSHLIVSEHLRLRAEQLAQELEQQTQPASEASAGEAAAERQTSA